MCKSRAVPAVQKETQEEAQENSRTRTTTKRESQWQDEEDEVEAKEASASARMADGKYELISVAESTDDDAASVPSLPCMQRPSRSSVNLGATPQMGNYW